MGTYNIPNPITDAHIAILWGGWSHERDISKDSAMACFSALQEAGFSRLELLDVAEKNFVSRLISTRVDLAFVAMHGPYGEDGSIQGLLEILHIPYTFSKVSACAQASNKALAKLVYKNANLPVAPALVVHAQDKVDAQKIWTLLGEKTVFVKPCSNGSSFGVSRVTSIKDLPKAIDHARKCSKNVLVEAGIEGKEITVGVIGYPEPFALPVVEINTGADFYTYDVKYEPSELHHVIPARLEADTLEHVQQIAVDAHMALGCFEASRSDFIVTKAGEPYLLETNVIPGMTSTSLMPDSAAHMGMPFPELCKHFVEWAFVEFAEQHQEK